MAGLWLTSCARPGTATAPPIDWLKQVQPFVNRAAPAYTPPLPTSQPFPTNAPSCQAGQLRAVGVPDGVGAGNYRYEVDFTNASQVPCQLSGTPQVQGLDPSGRLVTLPLTVGTYFLDPIPADIAPGESGYLNIGMFNAGSCPDAPAPVTYSKLRFGLPGGGWISTDISVTRACGGLTISGLGKEPGPVVEPSPNPGSIETLAVSLEGFPQQARTATTVHFVVVLANPSQVAVRLSPCSSYTEIINPYEPISRSLYLNCDHVTVIPPGARVRYAMELEVPQRLPHQAALVAAKWSWRLNVPYPAAGIGGVLTVQS